MLHLHWYVYDDKVAGGLDLTRFVKAGVAFLNGLVFASYGVFIRAQLPHAMDEPTLSQVCLAGAGSGIVAS